MDKTMQLLIVIY